jgi:hypothetical protein
MLKAIALFKTDIARQAEERGLDNRPEMQDFLRYIQDYKIPPSVKKEVPFSERCRAKNANNEQCTRHKQKGKDFCGTHLKSAPFGCIDGNKVQKIIQVYTRDINGIIYYVDDNDNVYNTGDILSHTTNPRIIGKCTQVKEDKYSIELSNVIEY